MFSGYSCHSTCSLANQQNHRGLQTCLQRSIYICFRSWFGRLGICISHESISLKSQTVCSQWSSWSRVPPKHDVWIRYRCFVGILERLSQISLSFSKRINNFRLVKVVTLHSCDKGSQYLSLVWLNNKMISWNHFLHPQSLPQKMKNCWVVEVGRLG